MTEAKTSDRTPIRQLPLYLPLGPTPRLDDAAQNAVVRLLAQLLASASAQHVDPEGCDEKR